MKFGEVVLWKDYHFPGGTIRDKLGVCLNRPTVAVSAILAFTTSRLGRYASTPGCSSDPPFFFMRGTPSYFQADTWILLHKVYEITLEEANHMKASGAMKSLSQLKQNQAYELRNCAIRSEDLPIKIIKLLKSST